MRVIYADRSPPIPQSFIGEKLVTEKLTTPQARIRAAIEAIGAITVGDMLDMGLIEDFAVFNQLRSTLQEKLNEHLASQPQLNGRTDSNAD